MASMGAIFFWVRLLILIALTRTFYQTPTSLALITQPHRWLAWTCDAIDFFSVSLNITALQNQFNEPTSRIVCTLFSAPLKPDR